MKRVAFILDAINTLGLYKSIASVYKKNGWDVVFVDTSQVRNSTPSEYLKNEITALKYQIFTPKRIVYKNNNRLFNKNADQILKHINPNLIFVPYEFDIYFFIVNLAKFYGIKTVHIQHGLWGGGKFKPNYNINLDSLKDKELNRLNLVSIIKFKLLNYSYRMLSIFFKKKYRIVEKKYKHYISRKLNFTLTADYIVVPSEYYENQIKNEVPSFKPKNILNPGYLRGDILFKDNQDIYTKFNLPKGKKIVSYFYSPFHLYPHRFKEKYSSNKALEEFISACNQIIGIDNIHILVLMHPTCLHYSSSLKEYLKKSFDNFSINHSMDSQGSIYKNSILIGGVKSGALTEAALFNRNIIRQDYVLDKNPEIFQIDYKLVKSVTSKKSMEATIAGLDLIVREKEKEENCFLEAPDGNCGQRLYQLLEE